ncbi:hydrogenase maturation nickel metallochaperone HypA/HybF [Gelidibacter salicanalis]|uniref:Hydrogenase maturation nickel metallochaperone HypA n=1 Tax=Gelidibacter salicanalis TaxID=291193 RepID=A0A934KWS0_9FLAO|nr:hydrogenase maturation nickel metallochaperone HypA [Gelidibacter salicanalis]MBJ7882012.1 hydrogenase maturation nickel metallochaperone HypA [Gelidibacter salicanalis]
MHEIFLIRNTFERIEEEFPEKFERVSEIHLKIGLLSNVQPILLTNAFKAFVMEFPQYYNTKLIIDTLPVIISCKCGAKTKVKMNRFVCERCKDPCRNIIQGEELFINEIKFKNKNEYDET